MGSVVTTEAFWKEGCGLRGAGSMQHRSEPKGGCCLFTERRHGHRTSPMAGAHRH